MPIQSLNRTILQVAVDQSAPGSTDIVVAPGTGMKIYVVTIVLSNGGTAAGTLKFTEGTGPTDLTGAMGVAVNGGFVIIGNGIDPVLATNTANAKLSVVTATAGFWVDGYIRYFLDK